MTGSRFKIFLKSGDHSRVELQHLEIAIFRAFFCMDIVSLTLTKIFTTSFIGVEFWFGTATCLVIVVRKGYSFIGWCGYLSSF